MVTTVVALTTEPSDSVTAAFRVVSPSAPETPATESVRVSAEGVDVASVPTTDHTTDTTVKAFGLFERAIPAGTDWLSAMEIGPGVNGTGCVMLVLWKTIVATGVVSTSKTSNRSSMIRSSF